MLHSSKKTKSCKRLFTLYITDPKNPYQNLLAPVIMNCKISDFVLTIYLYQKITQPSVCTAIPSPSKIIIPPCINGQIQKNSVLSPISCSNTLCCTWNSNLYRNTMHCCITPNHFLWYFKKSKLEFALILPIGRSEKCQEARPHDCLEDKKAILTSLLGSWLAPHPKHLLCIVLSATYALFSNNLDNSDIRVIDADTPFAQIYRIFQDNLSLMNFTSESHHCYITQKVQLLNLQEILCLQFFS